MAIRKFSQYCSAPFAVLLAAFTLNAPAADIIIAAGESALVEQGVARAICRQIEKSGSGLSCEVRTIEGRDAAEPLAILSSVNNGAVEIGIVASDWQYHAVEASGPVEFMDVRFDNLRSLLALYPEPFAIIARRDSGITTIDDLPGKRINIGPPGSRQRTMMNLLMAARGWTRDSFLFTDEINEAGQFLALCHDRVEAIITTAPHPDEAIAKTIELCDAQIVTVSGEDIDKLIAGKPYLVDAEIPGGLYAGAKNAVPTFGVTMTAVTSADTSDETVDAVIGAVLGDYEVFRKRHRVLADLTPQQMATAGLSATPHPAAVRYQNEHRPGQ